MKIGLKKIMVAVSVLSFKQDAPFQQLNRKHIQLFYLNNNSCFALHFVKDNFSGDTTLGCMLPFSQSFSQNFNVSHL